MCDAMIVCTGLSERHVVSLGHILSDVAKDSEFPIISIEGEQGGRWVLVDCGDIVVHIMTQEARDLYHLEKLWGHAFDEHDQHHGLHQHIKKHKST